MFIEAWKIQVEDKRNPDLRSPIREKYVHLTPEERVRQKTIYFLTDQLHVPKECVIVEKSLSTLGDIGNRKRIDIVGFQYILQNYQFLKLDALPEYAEIIQK